MKTVTNLKDKLIYEYIANLYCTYWKHKRQTTLTINNTTLTIPINTYEEAFELFVITRTEQKLITELLTHLNPGDTYLDIGANIGIHTLFTAKHISPNGHVLAIEPHPQNYQTLNENITKTNHSEIIHTRNYGLSNKNKILTMTNPQTIDGSAHLTTQKQSHDTIQIPAKTGDTICNEENLTPTAIKIDVEGAEGLVLDGLTQTLAHNDCTLLIVELHHPNPNANRPAATDHNHTREDIHNIITQAGFHLKTEYPRNYETQLIYKK